MAKSMMDIGLVKVLDGSGALVGEDVAVVAGDFSVVESSEQHGVELIENNKGDFKENPAICVGAVNYLDGDDVSGLLNAISEQFLLDGIDVKGVALGADGSINASGYYK